MCEVTENTCMKLLTVYLIAYNPSFPLNYSHNDIHLTYTSVLLIIILI